MMSETLLFQILTELFSLSCLPVSDFNVSPVAWTALLYRVAQSILLDDFEAEDVVQETFIKAWVPETR
jgi:hypothetical protein